MFCFSQILGTSYANICQLSCLFFRLVESTNQKVIGKSMFEHLENRNFKTSPASERLMRVDTCIVVKLGNYGKCSLKRMGHETCVGFFKRDPANTRIGPGHDMA